MGDLFHLIYCILFLAQLCSDLASLLQAQDSLHAATLCYICGRDLESVVKAWIAQGQALPDLVEKVSLLQRSVSDGVNVGPQLADRFSEYAQILATQGRVQESLQYISFMKVGLP